MNFLCPLAGLIFQSLENGNSPKPNNVFLWGSVGTGKSLLLVEILQIYMSFFAYFKKETKVTVLVLVYHSFMDKNSKLINDFEQRNFEKFMPNGIEIKFMTFEEACKGI